MTIATNAARILAICDLRGPRSSRAAARTAGTVSSDAPADRWNTAVVLAHGRHLGGRSQLRVSAGLAPASSTWLPGSIRDPGRPFRSTLTRVRTGLGATAFDAPP